MVSQDVDPSVAASEKRTQQPADKRDDNRADNRAPEAVDFETGNDLANEFQHQRVDDQNEQSKRDQDQRKAQEKQYRADKRINDSKKQRRAEETADSRVVDSDDRRRYKHGKRRHEPSKHEVPHGSHYDLPMKFAQINAQAVASPHHRAKS
jgi:hypothetical protein